MACAILAFAVGGCVTNGTDGDTDGGVQSLGLVRDAVEAVFRPICEQDTECCSGSLIPCETNMDEAVAQLQDAVDRGWIRPNAGAVAGCSAEMRATVAAAGCGIPSLAATTECDKMLEGQQALGESCDLPSMFLIWVCQPGLICQFTADSATCQPGQAEGQPCDSAQCLYGLECVSGVCEQPAAVGAACNDDDECASQTCENGQCAETPSRCGN